MHKPDPKYMKGAMYPDDVYGDPTYTFNEIAHTSCYHPILTPEEYERRRRTQMAAAVKIVTIARERGAVLERVDLKGISPYPEIDIKLEQEWGVRDEHGNKIHKETA